MPIYVNEWGKPDDGPWSSNILSTKLLLRSQLPYLPRLRLEKELKDSGVGPECVTFFEPRRYQIASTC
jgi:hypothetical protein